jgi:hypothetical protein
LKTIKIKDESKKGEETTTEMNVKKETAKRQKKKNSTF